MRRRPPRGDDNNTETDPKYLASERVEGFSCLRYGPMAHSYRDGVADVPTVP